MTTSLESRHTNSFQVRFRRGVRDISHLQNGFRKRSMHFVYWRRMQGVNAFRALILYMIKFNIVFGIVERAALTHSRRERVILRACLRRYGEGILHGTRASYVRVIILTSRYRADSLCRSTTKDGQRSQVRRRSGDLDRRWGNVREWRRVWANIRANRRCASAFVLVVA